MISIEKWIYIRRDMRNLELKKEMGHNKIEYYYFSVIFDRNFTVSKYEYKSNPKYI